MKNILIVVPTYNEAGNVGQLASAIRKVFKYRTDYGADILFVDDNSPDGTSEIIRKLQPDDPGIYLLNGDKEGLGRAYTRGLAYGLKLKQYFAIVMMDADFSHDPAQIPDMLAQLDMGADYVIGSRYTRGGRIAGNYPFWRRLQSFAANFLAEKLIDLGAEVKDMTSGFKVIRRSSLSGIPLENITVSGYGFQVALLYEFAKRNFVVREVPIRFWPRRQGSSKLGLHDITEFLWMTYCLTARAKLQRIIRFAIVGASGAAVNLLTLIVLVQAAHFDIMLAYPLALEVSIINNFFLNHKFTFSGDDRTAVLEGGSGAGIAGKLMRYNAIALIGAAISWMAFMFLAHNLHIGYVIADILSIGVATSWNYWLSVRLVWPVTGDPAPELHNELQET